MKIVVVGAGALGGFYGGLLARAGADVTFLARGSSLEAIRTNGLQVRSRLAGDFALPVTATDDPASLDSPDLVFLSVKAYDLAGAVDAIAPVLGPESTVLAVQNGIDHPDRIAGRIGKHRVLPGVVYISATIAEPGVIDQVGGPGRVLIGELEGGMSARVKAIASVFRDAGVAVETYDDIRPSLWEKFMVICAMSGVSALTRLTLREILDVPESRRLYLDVMEEVAAIARASGVALPSDAAPAFLETMLAMTALPLRGSMAYDLMAGRRLELETLNGAVVRIGESLGVATPMNRAIYLALKPLADGQELPSD